MGIIAWIVVGAIAGFIATFIMGNREGVLMTIVLGIAGALVGGFLAGALLDLKDPTGINIETIVVSVIGAIIVIFVADLLLGRPSWHGLTASPQPVPPPHVYGAGQGAQP